MLDALRASPVLQGCGRILVALSGGRDSVCLLHGLHALGLPLYAGHVHHGIRRESDEEADFVAELCRQLDVPLLVRRVDAPALAREAHLSLEEAARRLRLDALRDMQAEAEAACIATAHHQRDQAETVLLNLTRGTGPDGLKGMRAENPPFIRPLLACHPDRLAAYALANRLSWREDATNTDVNYSRNRVRLEVLPRLEQINPAAVRTVARCADLMAEEDDYMTSLAESWLDAHGALIPAKAFSAEHPALQRRILRRALARGDALTDLSMARLENLRAWCLAAESNGTFPVTPRLTARREYGNIAFGSSAPAPAFCLPLETVTPLPCGLGTLHVGQPPEDTDPRFIRVIPFTEGAPVTVRTRLPGDRISLPRCGTRKLKDVLIDKKLPKAQRDRLVLVACGSRVLWAVGLCGEPLPENGITLWWSPQSCDR